MKRSEMIGYIVNELAYYDHNDYSTAEDILKMLEDNGMLPPSHINPKYRHMCILQHTDMRVSQDLYARIPTYEEYELNEWEPEDEKI